MPVKRTSLRELNRQAYENLRRELGVLETVRFFGQLGLGTGNYTEERKHLFADLTLEGYREALEKMTCGQKND
jgi:hypothetical protein